MLVPVIIQTILYCASRSGHVAFVRHLLQIKELNTNALSEFKAHLYMLLDILMNILKFVHYCSVMAQIQR